MRTRRERQILSESLASDSVFECEDCGSDQVLMIAVGRDTLRGPGGILVRRAVRDRAWCERCAQRRGWLLMPEKVEVLSASCAT